jgi:hypothetical protein
MKMKRLPSEANSGRAIPPMGGTRRKLRADEQESRPRAGPTRREELAQLREGVWFTRGSKCGPARGRDAVEQRALTWGIGAQRRWPEANLPGAIRGRSQPRQVGESDAIVVGETSRGRKDARLNCETGGLTSMKGRTEVCPNRGTDAPADNAGRRGMDESRHDGKHVDAQERASVRSARGFDPCLIGTAVYGPVRTVVWDRGWR